MFTLRKYLTSGIEFNETLGKSYSVTKKITNEELFNKEIIKYLGEDFLDCNIVALIDCEEGRVIPIYRGTQCYILTDGGRTYDNLSIT